ncbi:MAG: ATP-binding protein [Paraglaciecola sp.]|nr:ATP-binding protein [Paraglaciecola sp.]
MTFFRFYFLVFSTVFFSIFTVCHAGNQSVPHFNLSEIGQTDISNRLPFYSVNSEKHSTPTSLPELNRLLSRLEPHKKTNALGDTYLTVFTLVNDGEQTAWFIYPFGSVVEHINVSIFNHFPFNSKAQTISTGQLELNSQDFHYGVPITLDKGHSITVLMLFKSEYFFAPIKIQIRALNELSQQFNIENVIMLLCLGVCMALAVYNFFIFFVVRQYQYLNYALATFCFALGWASIFGLPEHLGLGVSTALLMSSFILGAVFYSLFFIQLLKMHETSAKTAFILKAVALLCIPTVFIAAYNPGIGLYLASVSTSVVMFIGLYVGAIAWYRGSITACYFTCALLAVLAPNAVGNFINLGLLPSYNLNIYLMGLIGNSLETLLFAFAISVKVREVAIRNLDLTLNLEKTVEQRTNELKQLNKELEQSNIELVEASLAKGRFLASMSHEIRTPLTSIIGYSDGILLGDIDKAEQDRVIKIIGDNGSHLLSVINDILDLSKIEANKLDFEFIPTSLFSILGQIESVVGTRARDKGLAFHIDYQFPLPSEILIDPTRLKQILFNLTNNAIKFTEHGFVGLTVKTEEQALVIIISDSGEGIAPSHLDKLFEPFTQADVSINRRLGGTGLGLSISKRLALGLGGDIQVKSAPRKGSSFTLSFTLRETLNTIWISSVGEICLAKPEGKSAPDNLPDFNGTRVLLADDHANNRELITIMLKRMNISVVDVENGEQVLEALFYQKFDLILLDIHMPKMDGLVALQKIKALGNITPVVALTANSMNHEVQYYLRLGFNDHLAKPISRTQFIDVLSRYLSISNSVQPLINRNDMLALTRDYQNDLRIQLSKFEAARKTKDIKKIQLLAHRISGSASSFGFDLLGKEYAELEYSATQEDELAVTRELPRIMRLTRQCIDLPLVDIPLGITNHSNSIEQLLKALSQLSNDIDNYLSHFQLSLTEGVVSSTLIAITELKYKLDQCGLYAAKVTLEELETLLKNDIVDNAKSTLLVIELDNQFRALRNFLVSTSAKNRT